MTPLSKTASFFYKALVATAFCIVLLLPQQVEARMLAGGVTERKMNRKITSMLKAARKNYDSGKVQVALENYWKILELDPQETFAYLELGEIYVELRIYDRAIELLEPGLVMAQREMDRDTVCYYFCVLTNAHLAMNQTGLANKTLIKAAEASPKNPMPRKILGDIYLANNRIADAIKAYKKAVELDPDYQPAKEKLGEVIAKHGDKPKPRPKDKRQIAEKAVQLPAQKPATVSAVRPAPEKPLVAVPATQPPRPLPMGAETDSEDDEEDYEEGEDSVDAAEKSGGESIVDDIEPMAMPVAQPVTAPIAAGSIPAAASAQSVGAEEIESQIDKLLAGTAEDKKAAVSFFLKLEEKGLTEIEELLYDPDPEVRIIAIRTLPEFKAFTPRVKTMLNDALEDPDPDVLKEIQKVLEQL